MIEKSLTNLGFRDKEISIFMTLAQLGPQSAGVIARRAGLNRATTYAVLDTLMGRGVVSKIEKDHLLTFSAVDPDHILGLLTARKDELNIQEHQLKLFLPQLQNASPHLLRPKVRCYEGIEGIKTVMEETLASKEIIFSYANLDAWKESPLYDYIKSYCHRRSFERKIPLKCLMYDTSLAREHFSFGHDLYEVHFIPKAIAFDASLINIFENKVVLVSLVPGAMHGIIIESQELAHTQKAIFELAWMGCDPVCVKSLCNETVEPRNA